MVAETLRAGSKFFDVHADNGSEIARQVLERIDELHDVDAAINGLTPDERRHQRQVQSRPIAEALKTWAQETTPKLSAIRTRQGLPLPHPIDWSTFDTVAATTPTTIRGRWS